MPKADFDTTAIPRPVNSPVAIFSLQSTQPGVLGAHAHLIERLVINKPHEIRYRADSADLNERAEHLSRLLIAVTDYIGVVISDICDVSNDIDKRYIIGCVDDLAGDVVGALRIAADELENAA